MGEKKMMVSLRKWVWYAVRTTYVITDRYADAGTTHIRYSLPSV
jgi:hypothetical protein